MRNCRRLVRADHPAGIVPENPFPFKFRYSSSPILSKRGRPPEKSFSDKFRCSKLVTAGNQTGTEPAKSLPDKSRCVTSQCPNSTRAGKAPDKSLPDKSKYVKERIPAPVRGRHSSGNPPVSPLPARFRVSKAPNEPHPVGNVPVNPFPDRSR